MKTPSLLCKVLPGQKYECVGLVSKKGSRNMPGAVELVSKKLPVAKTIEIDIPVIVDVNNDVISFHRDDMKDLTCKFNKDYSTVSCE